MKTAAARREIALRALKIYAGKFGRRTWRETPDHAEAERCIAQARLELGAAK